jgi:hypothetical protein
MPRFPQLHVARCRPRYASIAFAHRVLEVLTALQLQIMAPSSLSSHLKPDLQLPDFCNSMQLLPPKQAHLRSP